MSDSLNTILETSINGTPMYINIAVFSKMQLYFNVFFFYNFELILKRLDKPIGCRISLYQRKAHSLLKETGTCQSLCFDLKTLDPL